MNKLFGIIGLFLFFILWFLVSTFEIIEVFFLPNPLDVLFKVIELLIKGNISLDIYSTLYRVLVSFILAAFFAILVGVIIGAWVKLYYLTELLLDFFRSIPATAIFPLFLLIFGVNDESKIAVTFWGIFLIIVFYVAQGVINSNKARIKAAELMGANKVQMFSNILIWETLPNIFSGLRIGISYSFMLIVITEMFIGTYVGLGKKIIEFQYTYDVVSLYAIIIILGLLGYLMNQILAYLNKKIVHWQGN
jgi:sulfonate transport system permease protein